MSLVTKEIAMEVHDNAVSHGWWDGKRDEDETIALIHSEWSEALEEARAGRPMVWYSCEEGSPGTPCTPADEYDCLKAGREKDCPYRGKKPEGIAVELIDGCIRILDVMARKGRGFIFKRLDAYWEELFGHNKEEIKNAGIGKLVCILHTATAEGQLETALGIALAWIKERGYDPEAILLEKHNYNKGRPYKHGKLF